MPDDTPVPTPGDIDNLDQLRCWPKKPVTVTVVRCKDHQPILMFTLSQPTTGAIIPVNNGTNIVRPCLLAGDTFRITANGYQPRDVTVPSSAITDGFMEVCLDEVPPPPPPRKPWPYCLVLTSLGVATESEYANILRTFRDVLLGTPGGRMLVNYYYDENVQKELISRLKKPARAVEVFRVLIEATPIIIDFVRPRTSVFGGACKCAAQTKLDVPLSERAVALLTSLLKETEDPRTKEALGFACSLVEKAAGKRPGQILDVLVSEHREKPVNRK